MKTLLAALAMACAAGAASADPLEGRWRTAPDDDGNSGLIEVAPCGAALCGTLVEAYDPSGAVIPSANLGRPVIWDTVAQGEGEYRGRVYSPDRDQEYASLLVLRGDSLSVSGCRLGFCREGGVWSRAD